VIPDEISTLRHDPTERTYVEVYFNRSLSMVSLSMYLLLSEYLRPKATLGTVCYLYWIKK
jgi:hypothetical protein